MRLIDADALNKKLCETTIFIKGGEIFQRMINDAPTIEPDGDLISRQGAIDAMWKALYAYEEELEQKFIQDQDVDYADYPVSRMWVQNGHDVCHKAILSLPSAPDSRQRGEWIWSPKDEDGTVSGCCSNCSFSHLFIGGHTAQYNFCHNCGADMRKGGEDK